MTESFGDVLKRLRTMRGLSQSQLARLAHLDATYISKLENGHRRPPPSRSVTLLDDVLTANGQIVAASAGRRAPTPRDEDASSAGRAPEYVDGQRAIITDAADTDVEEGWIVKRRRLVEAIATLGLAAPVAAQLHHILAVMAALGDSPAKDQLRVSAIIDRLADHTSGPSDADAWEEAAWEYGYSYVVRPRADLLRDMAVDFATIRLDISRTTRDKVQQALHDSAARIAALTAMAYTDLGMAREATHSWRQARQHSDKSINAETQLWIRGQEAITSLYLNRPLPVVHSLVTKALTIPSKTPLPGKAILLAAKAQTLSLEGRGDDAVATLPQIRRVVDALDLTIYDESIMGWSEGRLRHTESFIRATCGQPHHAHLAHDDAWEYTKPSRTISRCQIEMHRAIRLVHDGDISGGIGHASEALGRLPDRDRGRYVLTVAHAALDRVPEDEISRSYVAEYTDQLAASNRRQ